ncbi:MAG TPA: winged helix-turn-helix domain-containing protein [Nitrosopumilaceae archaeon]|nr:winged helix-turn-helix domain-containing protein [Nitrosopumilaceae archaeon]
MAPSTKNINVDVMNRILKVLYEQSPIKLTNLAMASGLNYNTCKRYLHLMKIFGWIETSSEDDVTMARITEAGGKIHSTLNDQ